MPLEGRDGLIARFKKGSIPKESDYHLLIDSMVNKKDDQFFGRWQRGMKYCQGDVVLFDKSLYMLNLQQEEDPCPEEETSSTEQADKESACICSTEFPDKDARWCLLELQMQDEDWKIILGEDGVTPIIVYNDTTPIGIGTKEPRTLLEVAQDIHAIQADPATANGPTIRWVRAEEGQADWVGETLLARELRSHTNTLGYAFFREAQTPAEVSEAKSVVPVPALLLLLTSSANDTPLVGIGTEDPVASLDVVAPQRARLMVHPFEGRDAATVLLDEEATNGGHYLATGVKGDTAYLQTDASQGLRIQRGGEVAGLEKELGQGASSVAIDGDGKVGIGTETPASLLTVKDVGGTGTIRADFSQSNACLSIINERPMPEKPPTYAICGIDGDFMHLSTDAEFGFVFKRGELHGDGKLKHEVNINQGDKIAFLSPEGKLGLQTPDVPTDYDLDVNGRSRTLEAYLHTDSSTIKTVGKLSEQEDLLDRVCQLDPVRYEYKADASKKRHLGFDAANVHEYFPDLTHASGSKKSVAYGNMTAVLVEAIKRQQALIAAMEDRICDLEELLKKGGGA